MEDKVKLSKRIIAYLLDILLVYLLISLISGIRFINPTYDKYVKVYNEYEDVFERYVNKEISIEEVNELNNDSIYKLTKYSVSTSVVIIVVIFGYFVLFQKYNNGQTLGKKIMKIKVVDANDNNISIIKYILRTIPMYYIFIGSIIPIIINQVVVFLVSSNTYLTVYSIPINIFLFINIISFVMIIKREDSRGLHDLLANTKVINE